MNFSVQEVDCVEKNHFRILGSLSAITLWNQLVTTKVIILVITVGPKSVVLQFLATLDGRGLGISNEGDKRGMEKGLPM